MSTGNVVGRYSANILMLTVNRLMPDTERHRNVQVGMVSFSF
nr:MAG TPA: hypothetical protein [Caudoviricetes sp.]